MKKGCVIPIIALSLLLVCVVAAAIAFLVLQAPASKLLVLINSPRHGEQVVVGEGTMVHAVARGDQKIKRVELWVDGKLYDAQNTPLKGGISPFPIAVNWRPAAPGAHTLIVRAYDARNARAHSSIQLEAIRDRDSDGTPDARDKCPDQPGPELNAGCPAVAPNDRDGDGIANNLDTCPDQAGSLLAQGCPDADGDSVPDSSDACPRDVGSPERGGCPIQGDADGDNVPDASDRCPSEPGDPASSGCPESPSAAASDRDGDGVTDVQDLCPDVPGPVTNSGCPPTGSGDRDGDGVDDGTDLAPEDPGSSGDGGAPPPGGDSDTDGDGIPDDEEPPTSAEDGIPDAGSWEALNVVQIEALGFSVTQDYDSVYCYVTAGDAAEHYGPFDLIGTRQWDIAEYMGGANSRILALPVGRSLNLHVECNGHYPSDGPFSIAPADLGSITRSYPELQWDGHVITERSGQTVAERGSAGHSFEVSFRICRHSCASSEFPPPALRTAEIRIGPFPPRPYLAWTWGGNEDNITGYRLYINGNRRTSVDASAANRVRLSLYDPPCGESYEYHVTAYRANADGFNARESPPSNTVTVQGAECPRRIQVRFVRMSIDQELDDWSTIGGPYYGHFWATGTGGQRLEFRAGECKAFLWIYACKGWHHGGGSIADMFEAIRNSSPELSGWTMFAPETDYVIVALDENDDLTVGAQIKDEDVYSTDDMRLNASQTFRGGVALPLDVTLTTGASHVTVHISEVEED